jgi:hypothetical protein
MSGFQHFRGCDGFLEPLAARLGHVRRIFQSALTIDEGQYMGSLFREQRRYCNEWTYLRSTNMDRE